MNDENRSPSLGEANDDSDKILRINELLKTLMAKKLEFEKIKRDLAVIESRVNCILQFRAQSIDIYTKIVNDKPLVEQLRADIENGLAGLNINPRNPVAHHGTQLLEAKLSDLKEEMGKMTAEKKAWDNQMSSAKERLMAIVEKNGDDAILQPKIAEIELAEKELNHLIEQELKAQTQPQKKEAKTQPQKKKSKTTQKSSPALAPQQESRPVSPAIPISALASVKRYMQRSQDQNHVIRNDTAKAVYERYLQRSPERNRANRNDSSCLVSSTNPDSDSKHK